MPSSSGKAKEHRFKLPESGSSSRIADCNSDLAVIVTHPWGPLGGNMNNNVVLAIAVWFQRLGITTMRFNFSGSQIGRGDYQVDNVREAANFLLSGQHLNPSGSKLTDRKNRQSLTAGARKTRQFPKIGARESPEP